MRFSFLFVFTPFLALTVSAVGPSNGPGALSASPPSGNGQAHVLSIQFSHTSQWQSLSVVNVLINNFLDGRNACYLSYDIPANRLYLQKDNGDFNPAGLAPGTVGGVLSNTQCLVNVAQSSVGGSNELLKLIVDVTYRSGFSGSKSVWAAARDQSGGNSGWQALGAWTVPGVASNIEALSVNPGRANAVSQSIISSSFKHFQSASSIDVANVLIKHELDGRAACYVAYLPAQNVVYLVADTGPPTLIGPLTLGSSTYIENTQCRINGQQSSASLSGQYLTLNLDVVLNPAFFGNKIIWTAARNATDNSGWHALGTWGNTTSSGPPAISGCSPQVYGVSEIGLLTDLRVYGISSTSMNYCAALYYDVLTAGYLYQDSAGPTHEFAVLDWPDATGVLTSAQPQQGPTFQLETDHYLVAYYVFYSQTPNVSPFYYNYFGYASTSPTYSAGQLSAPFAPTNTPLFSSSEYIYLGTTAVSIATADDTPVLLSVAPDVIDAGQTQTVIITGQNFGAAPAVNFEPPNDLSVAVVSASSTTINLTVTVAPNADLGERTVQVTSNGSTGFGFLQGPGREDRSNKGKTVIRGAAPPACPVILTPDGQVFSLLPARNYLQAEIPLRAESTCPGTVSWEIKFTYQTSGKRGQSTSDTTVLQDSLRLPNQSGSSLFVTPRGRGGLVEIIATVTTGSGASQNTRKIASTLWVAGEPIPEAVVKARLNALYQNYPATGTPLLLVGIARTESQLKQFGHYQTQQPFQLLGKVAWWPMESYDGGSHIGIMQGPAGMLLGFDWEENTSWASSLFLSQKLAFAGNYEATMRSIYPGLRALTYNESESNALVYYGPPSVRAAQGCTDCPGKKIGPYWVPNANGSDWIVNQRKNPGAVTYVTKVRNNAY